MGIIVLILMVMLTTLSINYSGLTCHQAQLCRPIRRDIFIIVLLFLLVARRDTIPCCTILCCSVLCAAVLQRTALPGTTLYALYHVHTHNI